MLNLLGRYPDTLMPQVGILNSGSSTLGGSVGMLVDESHLSSKSSAGDKLKRTCVYASACLVCKHFAQ